MRNERVRAANKVAQQLAPTEANIDTAMASLAALTGAMLTARAEANLSHCVGQDAFDHIGEATALLFKVRSKVVDAHLSLHQTQVDIGLRETSFGPSQANLNEDHAARSQTNVIAIAS
jgi:hypothetical protein